MTILPFDCADAARGRDAAPASAAAPMRTSRRDVDLVMMTTSDALAVDGMLRWKDATCRFAPADMHLLPDDGKRLLRPVLDLHDHTFERRQADVQIHLRAEIGDEFNGA